MNDLLAALARVETLASASKLQRLLHAPGRYLYATLMRRLPSTGSRQGVLRAAATFFGTPMQVLLPAGTDIYLLGGKSHDSEIRLARFLIHRLRPGDAFLDVGAHFGFFALLAARLVGPTGRVLALEAAPRTYAVLAANVANLPQVTARHRAAAATPHELVFYEFPPLYNEFNSFDVSQFEQEPWYAANPPKQLRIPAIPLDEATRELPAAPAIIKIDVEGAEYQVIDGARQLLTTARPFVVMEYVEPKRHNAAHRQALQLLGQLGYAPHLITPSGGLQPCPDVDAYLLAQGLDSENIVFVKA